MRIAIVSDIHGNRTAFDAVLADLRTQSSDLMVHGGDLTDAGSSPAEIIECVRELGWPGVMGNTDEKLFRPESLENFAAQSSAPATMWQDDGAPSIRRVAYDVEREASAVLTHGLPHAEWAAKMLRTGKPQLP